MKKLPMCLALVIFASLQGSSGLEIKIEPCWRYLDNDNVKAKISGNNGSWILAGTITIKKRIKDAIILEKLVLSWKGNAINSMLGSLYRKKPGKTFLPLEEYVICDSIWNKKEQKLIYKFDRPVSLDAQTELCFVLTVPDDLEDVIKSGQFELQQDELPLLIVDALPREPAMVIAFK